VQRLRRIHQLGVSEFTYPGASHTRFSHTLGVLHLTQLILNRVGQLTNDAAARRAREVLLAAAVLHDVGHGPFSHLFEPCLATDHEEWSVRIVREDGTQVNEVLRRVDGALPEAVAQLIEKDNYDLPEWQKYLLSSQLDADRMDYLRRDSLFTGSGYGHFDWHRLINTLEFHDEGQQRDIVWPEKAKFAIEEYIFARFYMYQNVYLHKTTRCFEKLLQAMWEHAKTLRDDGTDVQLVPAIAEFWGAGDAATVSQYLAIEEFTVLQQIQQWKSHPDNALSDLARRFLDRDRLAMIEAPLLGDDLTDGYAAWEDALRELVQKAGFDPDMYCLRDQLKGKYNQPYFPEKESDEQSAKNAIRIKVRGETQPIEISTLLPRLQPITTESQDRYRYYVPAQVREAAHALKEQWGR
jgi:HD superfamily phosphohydrolase